MTAITTNKLLLAIIAILLPPLAVYLKRGRADQHLLINIVLCFLFWIPAVLHALWLIFK